MLRRLLECGTLEMILLKKVIVARPTLEVDEIFQLLRMQHAISATMSQNQNHISTINGKCMKRPGHLPVYPSPEEDPQHQKDADRGPRTGVNSLFALMWFPKISKILLRKFSTIARRSGYSETGWNHSLPPRKAYMTTLVEIYAATSLGRMSCQR